MQTVKNATSFAVSRSISRPKQLRPGISFLLQRIDSNCIPMERSRVRMRIFYLPLLLFYAINMGSINAWNGKIALDTPQREAVTGCKPPWNNDALGSPGSGL